MAKSGAKKTPHKLAVVQGVVNKKRLNPDEPKADQKLPQCPSWLHGTYAHSVWKRMSVKLNKMGVLPFICRDLFAAYCIAVQDLKDAVQSDDFNKRQKATQRMRMCAAEMGITPTSMASLRVPDDDEGDDLD